MKRLFGLAVIVVLAIITYYVQFDKPADKAPVYAEVAEQPKAEAVTTDTVASPEPTKSTKILLIGDSLMEGPFGQSLEDMLKAHYIPERIAKSSSGLIVESFYNWYQVLSEHSKDYAAVIILLGTNDGQGIGKVNYTDVGWPDLYKAKIKKLLDLVPSTTKVYWLTPPSIVGNTSKQIKFDKKVEFVGEVITDACHVDDKCSIIDFRELTNDNDLATRRNDGIHFNNVGGYQYALDVYNRLNGEKHD